jgi:hypothetical protein
VEIGLIGIILLIAVVASALKDIGRLIEEHFDYAGIRLTYLAIILMNNLTESSLLKGTHSLWFLFLLFVINIPQSSMEAIHNNRVN